MKLTCQKSMSDLGVDYLDLYLLDFSTEHKFVPINCKYPSEWETYDTANGMPQKFLDSNVHYYETWRAMEQLVQEGLVRNIGFYSTNISTLRQILSFAKIKPAVL